MLARVRVVLPVLGALGLLRLMLPGAAYAAWPSDPSLNLPVSVAGGLQNYVNVAPDGHGGTFLMWEDKRDSATTGIDLYAQDVDGAGIPRWAPNGVPVSTRPDDEQGGAVQVRVLAIDGSGGVIMAFEIDGLYQSRLQRLDYLTGARQWGPTGIPVTGRTGSQINPKVLADGAGGVFVSWSGVTDENLQAIFAQHYDHSGTPLWSTDGVIVCSSVVPQAQEMVSDGAGGLLIAWQDYRSPSGGDLYAQRLDAAGVPQWATNGVPICTAPGYSELLDVSSDGAGGMVLTWSDDRSADFQTYAQRISGAGIPLWTSDGVPACVGCPSQYVSKIAAAGDGGAIVAWQQSDQLRAQRYGPNGARLWGEGGAPLCLVGNPELSGAISIGYGGAYFVWADSRSGSSDIYAQRLLPDGSPRWPTNGVAVCTALGGQADPVFAVSPFGFLTVAWWDRRDGAGDVYAQEVDANGTVGGVVDVPETPSPTRGLSLAVPPLGKAPIELRFHLPHAGRTELRVFDVHGRAVAKLLSGPQAGGDHVVSWDVDGSSGTGVAGVYFVRLGWEGEQRVARIVALH